MNADAELQVPTGFEIAHEEWLARGGKQFRRKYIIGAHGDFYQTSYWALVRQAVLARDSATCFRCQGIGSDVHHLNYNFTGEDHLHPESLVSVCGSCHLLIEYARLADSMIPKIQRKILWCKKFLDDAPDRVEQNAAKVCTELLGYQKELTELQNLFDTKTSYKDYRIQLVADAKAGRYKKEWEACESQAAKLVSAWEGDEKQKLERLIPMLEVEIENYQKFVAKVLESVSPLAERLEINRTVEAVAKSERKVSGVEALVVGIKFHRGHTDGIVSGESVQLVREPNNAYDPNAVRVNLQTGETLGYLTKEFAAVFAKQLDAGEEVQAQVSKIVRDKVYVAVIRAEH